MTVKDRLKIYCKEQNTTISAFEESIGVSNGYVNSISKSIGIDKIDAIIENYSNINIEWLLTGRGDMLKAKDVSNIPSADDQSLPIAKGTKKTTETQEKKTRKASKGLPLIPIDAVAGFPVADNDGVYMEDCEHYSIPEFEAKGANFLIRVSGDSMMPLYNNGDIIACRKISDILFFQWGSIYVLDTSQGALVKRIEECEKNDDCILCVSENPRFKPFQLPKTDIRSLSTIIGLVRLV
ncbi:MAG: LexA family transcriptional regulator [Prevotella sp.]|nr:LexA family transcriptional regulator [Prevotella sp.]